MRKGVVVGVVVAAAVLVSVEFRFLSSREIASTSSARGRYTIQIGQERPFPGYERYVYLNVSRAGEAIVRRKLLYTGDMLDDDFGRLYPGYSWPSESVLRIGQVGEAEDDTLRVSNETPRRLTYLLVETYRDKFVLFDVEPGAVVTLAFNYFGRLSSEGEFQGSGERFADAVEVPDGALSVERERFSIGVRENTVTIDGQRQLLHVGCCALDRPGFTRD